MEKRNERKKLHTGRKRLTALMLVITIMATFLPGLWASAEIEIAASAGSNDFTTLQGAIDAVCESPSLGTIILKRDVTESVTIPAGKTVTIDLGGKTLTNVGNTHTITNKGTLNLKSTGATATLDNVAERHAWACIFNDRGTVEVAGSIDIVKSRSNMDSNLYSWYNICNRGTMTLGEGVNVINNGKWHAAVTTGYLDISNEPDYPNSPECKLTVNGAAITGGTCCIKVDSAGVLEMNSGTLTNEKYPAIINWNVATINGGTIDAWNCVTLGKYNRTGSDAPADPPEKGIVTINGGTFTGKNTVFTKSGSSENAMGAVVTIKGGTFNGVIPDRNFLKTATIFVEGGRYDRDVTSRVVLPDCMSLSKKADNYFHAEYADLQEFKRVDPTCDEIGYEAYWVCEACECMFADKDHKIGIEAPLIIPSLGHDWKEPVDSEIKWKPTAGKKPGDPDYFKPEDVIAVWRCGNNGEHTIETTAVEINLYASPEQSCIVDGVYRYEARFPSPISSDSLYTASKSITVKAHGHKYGAWIELDEKEHIRYCEHDETHAETKPHKWDSGTVLEEPTDLKEGVMLLTCTVCGAEQKAPIDKLDPDNGLYEFKDSDGYLLKELSWQKGSGKTLDLLVKRKVNDKITFESFAGLEINGKKVDESFLKKEEGSLKLYVDPKYMETLDEGEHDLKVRFKDGSASTKLTVNPAPKADEGATVRIRKTVSGSAETDKAYRIEIWFLPKEGEPYSDIISLKPGEEKEYKDLLEGMIIELKELDADGYTVTYLVNGKETTEARVTAEPGAVFEIVVNNDKKGTPDPSPKPGEKDDNDLPKTGDGRGAVALICLVLLSACGAAVSMKAGRKRSVRR